MVNYKITILEKKPHLINKKLLLINKKREKLFQNEKQEYIEIEINSKGELSVYKFSSPTKKVEIDFSLRKIGETFLGLNDPSVNQVLNYFVLPEMEIERIFNNLRYKYLKTIQLSNFNNPSKFISANYNKSFQSLADIEVYQGNTKERKPNDFFWKNEWFSQTAKDMINFDIEKQEMNFILNYLRRLEICDYNKIYAELIAIKPGFHEIVIHDDYFDKKTYPIDNSIRSDIFRLLRGIGELSDIKINNLPHEINSKSYFTYASCNITEGPFVFRKNISISYFDEIKNIKTKKSLQNLQDNFYYLDYSVNTLNTIQDINNFLLKAEKFRYFM